MFLQGLRITLDQKITSIAKLRKKRKIYFLHYVINSFTGISNESIENILWDLAQILTFSMPIQYLRYDVF